MWSSIMAPQGHSFMPEKQQQREFGMLLPALPISAGKSFKNPNFVNNFNKYQDNVKPVDISTNNYQNSCHTHIIDSIKKQCPDIIPSSEEDSISPPESIPTAPPEMCLGNNKTKPSKIEPLRKSKRKSGKRSRHNQKRQDINELLEEEDIQDSMDNSTDICSSPQRHTLILQDFIVQEPSPYICLVSKPLVQSIEIPISSPTMVFTKINALSPCRSRQYSVTDSEDSFIVFDHDGNEEELSEDEEDANSSNQESLCNRFRKLSLCESEDSFILFEGGDAECQDDDSESRYSFDSSDEEDYQEDDCHNDLHNENSCDDVDSSFTIVDRKKVRFASDHELCEVHPMIKWSYAYQAARKGPWEMYARDRCRFAERASRVEREIKHVFDPQHRDRIYKERFENL